MDKIHKLFSQAIGDLYGISQGAEITRPDTAFGDFATNVALIVAKKIDKNPRQVASEIVDYVSEASDELSLEVAGPGFINIRVSDQLLAPMLEVSTKPNNQVIVIETNNPNPFKAMHIGHAFNAILADTIANLLESSGAETHRVSYHGDVGLHVGKSMYSLLKYADGNINKLEKIDPKTRNNFMSKMYAEGARAYKEDVSAKAQIDKLAGQSFVLDDPFFRQVYDTCMQWSFQQIDELVSRLGNKPTEKRYLESQADKLGVDIVKQHIGDVFVESDGALLFPGSKYGSFDNVFVGSNGLGLYGARDLGLMQLKDQDYHPQKSYIVTAEEQRDYFKGVIKASELCLPKLKNVTVNISTGTVKLTSGKMSSRSGDVIEVAWLFNQIKQALADYNNDNDAIIAGAIRYQFLKVRIGSDVIFDIEGATQLQGNTGPYLQYAYARSASILRKRSVDETDEFKDLEPDEHQLLLKLSEYNEVLTRAQNELLPHLVANYVYELTQSFNSFYEKNRVIDDPREAVRLRLVHLYQRILKSGLEILGIPILEKM